MKTGRPRPWDLAQLQLFVTVVREGSFTRVAASTGTPQPAISRQIARLEAQCGGRLFLRTGRGVTLSALGERILPYVQTILQGTQELAQELDQGIRSPRGEVRIGVLPSLYLSLIMPLFDSLRRRMPEIRLHVFEGSGGQIDQWLTSGFIDIGLPYRYGPRVPAGVERLATVSSFLVGPPGDELTQPTTIKFTKLNGLPLVLPSAPSSVRLLLDQLARKARITLNVVMEADSTQIQKAASRWGGYTVLPLHAVATEVEEGSLQAAHIVEPKIDRMIVMDVTSSRPASQATREVARTIRQLMRGWPLATPDKA